MKNIQILILFLIGAALIGVGVVCRMMEYEAASFFLIVGMTFTSITVFLLIIKLLRKNKSDSFLDS